MSSVKFDLKRVLFFIRHVAAAVLACLAAFAVSVRFLTPALSEDPAPSEAPAPAPPPVGQKSPQSTIGGAAKKFIQESGKVFQESFGKQESSKAPAGNLPAASPDPPPPAPEEASEDKPVPVEDINEALLEVESYMAPFTYDPLNRRDPFEDPFKTRIAEPVEEIEVKTPTPPELYTPQEINLKGVIWRTAESPKALVRLPDGAFYTLLKGDKIGKNGVIFEIREDEVVILETMTKQIGNKTVKDNTITIKRMNRMGQGARRLHL